MRPIFEVMKEKQLIAHEMFSLCLGKNGGYFQIGGYDGTNHISNEVTWIPTWETHAYKFSLFGISINNHMMSGSEEFSIGVVDSGTTFTYVPQKLFTMLLIHFDWFCSLDTEHHCKGKRMRSEDDPSTICFEYDESLYPTGPKPFFLSYPVLNFHANAVNNTRIAFKWYPSEYLFRHKATSYCLALEKFSRSNEILMGGTFMRQNNIVFDVEGGKLGFARARCNDDKNMILDEKEMIQVGG